MERKFNAFTLARMEAVCKKVLGDSEEKLMVDYKKAVEYKNEIAAAELARKLRNKMLADSDKEYTLDKVLPEAPTGTAFKDWLGWLKQLSTMKINEWGKYRQALRDLPQQEGFPFNIEFPQKPIKK